MQFAFETTLPALGDILIALAKSEEILPADKIPHLIVDAWDRTEVILMLKNRRWMWWDRNAFYHKNSNRMLFLAFHNNEV